MVKKVSSVKCKSVKIAQPQRIGGYALESLRCSVVVAAVAAVYRRKVSGSAKDDFR